MCTFKLDQLPSAFSNLGELWPIKDVGHPYYASRSGHILRAPHIYKTTFRGKPIERQLDWKILCGQKTTTRGYQRVNIAGRILHAHTHIAKTFIDNPEDKPQVNHINGIKTDNRVENLEWVTNTENREHAVRTGLITYETQSRNAKIKRSDWKRIAKNYSDGMTQAEIASQYGVKQQAVSRALKKVLQ